MCGVNTERQNSGRTTGTKLEIKHFPSVSTYRELLRDTVNEFICVGNFVDKARVSGDQS